MRITGGVQGDAAANSFVYVPSLKVREDWTKTLDQIEAVKPVILVPVTKLRARKTICRRLRS